MTTRSKDGIFKPKVFTMTSCITEPKIVKQALANDGWRKSIQDEFDGLVRNQIWVLAPKPPNGEVNGSKWIWRIKKLKNHSLDKLKYNVVA